MASQNTKLNVGGIVSSPNPFGSSPDGSLAAADNCVIRNAGIIESRRGFDQQSLLSGGARGTSFQSHFISLVNDAINYYDTSWHALAGSFTAPSGVPMRFQEAASELYFTTNAGIQRMSTFSTNPIWAGLPRPFSIVTFTTLGPGPLKKAVYRVVYGYRTATGTPVLSAPSGAYTALVGETGPRTVLVPFVPRLLSYPGAFIRLYRSRMTDTTSEPLDETFLVAEVDLGTAAIAPFPLDSIEVNDNVSDDFLGVALYTNATQEGVGQANDPPPISKDVCVFRGVTVYANTQDYQRLIMTLYKIGGEDGLLIGDAITFGGTTYTSVPVGSEDVTTQTFAVYPDTLTPAARIAATLESLINCVIYNNSNPYAFYLGSGCTPSVDSAPAASGRLLLEGALVDSPAFTVSFSATPYTLGPGKMVRTLGSTVTVTQPGHPFQVGSQVSVVPSVTLDPDFPAATQTVTAITGTTWSYDQAGANVSNTHTYIATHVAPSTAWRTDSGFTSTNSADVAGLRYSKTNEPNACPLEDQDTVGKSGAAVLRVVPLRESVLIWKEDGLYRLTGDSTTDFSIQPYDLTIRLPSPETARALSNIVIAWTDKGVWGYSESAGGQSFSLAIDEALFDVRAEQPVLCAETFAMSYESDQLYLLWLPDASTPGGNTGFPYTLPIDFSGGVLPGGQALVFNARTSAWTRWTVQAVDAFVDPATDTIIVLDGGQVLQERKSATAEDYQDVGGSANITLVTDSKTITMSGPGVGDVVTQGAYTSRVLEVNGGVLTLDTAGTWTLASADYAKAIDCNVTWLPEAGENPGTTKQFQEHSLNFRAAAFKFIDAHYSTDVTPTEVSKRRWGDPDSSGNVNVRTLMPVNMARGVMLSTGFRHQQALCNFELQGSSIKYRQTSTRTPSHAK